MADYVREQANSLTRQEPEEPVKRDLLNECLEVLKSGHPQRGAELCKKLTAEDRRKYISFGQNNFERLRKITQERIKREALMPPVSDDNPTKPLQLK